MKRGGLADFGLDYFSRIGQDFRNRKSKIKSPCFKVCSRCGETKQIFKFSVDKRNTNGLTNICRGCRSLEYLEYYYQNKEKILIKCKEYRDTNKENRSAYSEKYREDHKEQLKKNAREWYKSNKKAIKKRNLKYYQENLVACQVRRGLWIIKNKEKIKKYNREYRKQRAENKKLKVAII